MHLYEVRISLRICEAKQGAISLCLAGVQRRAPLQLKVAMIAEKSIADIRKLFRFDRASRDYSIDRSATLSFLAVGLFEGLERRRTHRLALYFRVRYFDTLSSSRHQSGCSTAHRLNPSHYARTARSFSTNEFARTQSCDYGLEHQMPCRHP
jgi:hypothetical protein